VRKAYHDQKVLSTLNGTGSSMAIHAGLGEPHSDSRNALIVKGSSSDATIQGCTFINMGLYIWTGADAKLNDCSMAGGLHGIHVWGNCDVSAVGCKIQGTELSGISIRDGAKVNIEVLLSEYSNVMHVWSCDTVNAFGLMFSTAPPPHLVQSQLRCPIAS
jgi:hypothetical protein